MRVPDLDIIPMLNGKYRDRYLYPRVQVKVLNEQIYIIGVGNGSDCVLQLIDKINTLDFGNITFEVNDKNIIDLMDQFQQTDQLLRYRFVTPWVALNQTTGRKYRALNNSERVNFLNKLLGENIVFIAKELSVDLEDKVFTKVILSSLFPKSLDENNWGAFSGEFSTNFNLPNYIGLGNGITRGYGAIYGLFDPQEFHFEKDTSMVNPGNKDVENDKTVLYFVIKQLQNCKLIDKIIVATALILLVMNETIQNYEVIAAIIILTREILVSGLREFLAKGQIKLPVSNLAKMKTFAQTIGIILLWLSAFLTLYTGYEYLRKGIDHAISEDQKN